VSDWASNGLRHDGTAEAPAPKRASRTGARVIRALALAGLVVIVLAPGGVRAGAAASGDPAGQPDAIDPIELIERLLRMGVRSSPPAFCFRQDLRPRVERLCDRLRFRGEPHFNAVRVARNGAVRSIRLLVTETGQEVFRAHPYGTAFAVPGSGDREVKMKTRLLRLFLRGRPTPGSTRRVWSIFGPVASGGPVANAAPTGYATGLSIGWNPSTGVTSGQCFNFTVATPSNNVEQASFSSENAASSSAQQINVSATVSGAADAFSASDTFSYSDQWQSSTNSTNQYYNFYSLYTLDSTVASLNSQGQAAGTSASTLCGSEYMSAVTVGMVATISINYGSTSSSTQTAISDQFKASFGLDGISSAVSTAQQDTSATSYFSFNMLVYGGGTSAAAALNEAFAETNSSGDAYYASCASGNTADCTTFSSNMGTGAATALSSFNGLVGALSGANGPDLSFFETFPGGVAGADTPAVVTTALTFGTTDVLEPYATALTTYTTLLNQIATLNNRVGAVSSRVSQDSFDPTSFLNLGTTLTTLQNDLYGPDRSTLLGNLTTCLAATSANVTTACAAIIANTVSSAYEWYDLSTGQNPNFSAQQNTIALQYTGTYTNNNSSSWPMDVVYIGELPTSEWSDVNEFVLIAGQAALVGFADVAFVNGGSTETVASLAFLPLYPNDDLSSVVGSVYTTQGTTAPGLWFSWYDNGPGPATNDASEPLVWLNSTETCAPTFSLPCAIGFGLESTAVDYPLSFQMAQIPSFFTPE
jgi:hypothetical protein